MTSLYTATEWTYRNVPIANIYVYPKSSQLRQLIYDFIENCEEPFGFEITIPRLGVKGSLDRDNSEKFQSSKLTRQQLHGLLDENSELLLSNQLLIFSIYGMTQKELKENEMYGEILEVKQEKIVLITTRHIKETFKKLAAMEIVRRERSSETEWKKWRNANLMPASAEAAIALNGVTVVDRFKTYGVRYVPWEED